MPGVALRATPLPIYGIRRRLRACAEVHDVDKKSALDAYCAFEMVDDAFSRDSLARRLGTQLQRIRRQRRWTQRELARQAGVPHYQISKYEKGLYLPPIPILLKLAQSLGVLVDLLVPHPQGPQNETDRLLREALLEVLLLPLADRKALVALLRPILEFFRPKDTLACRGGDPPGD